MKTFLLIVAFSLLLAGCALPPEETPSPTATPRPLRVQQQIAKALQADQAAVAGCFLAAARTTPVVELAEGAVTITSNVSSVPFHVTDDRAKECIFALERDAWKSDPAATQVTVHVQILLPEKNGKPFTGDTAWAVLKQATERKLVWANLSYTQAWSDYDETWLLPGNA